MVLSRQWGWIEWELSQGHPGRHDDVREPFFEATPYRHRYTHIHLTHLATLRGSHTQREAPHPNSCLCFLSAYLHLCHPTPSPLYLLSCSRSLSTPRQDYVHDGGNRVEAAKSTSNLQSQLDSIPSCTSNYLSDLRQTFAPLWALVSPNAFCLNSKFVTWYFRFPGLGGPLRLHCHLIPFVLEFLGEAKYVPPYPPCPTDQRHLPQRPIPASSPSELLFRAFWRYELTEHTQYN